VRERVFRDKFRRANEFYGLGARVLGLKDQGLGREGNGRRPKKKQSLEGGPARNKTRYTQTNAIHHTRGKKNKK
jgi:hypothetical protein